MARSVRKGLDTLFLDFFGDVWEFPGSVVSSDNAAIELGRLRLRGGARKPSSSQIFAGFCFKKSKRFKDEVGEEVGSETMESVEEPEDEREDQYFKLYVQFDIMSWEIAVNSDVSQISRSSFEKLHRQ